MEENHFEGLEGLEQIDTQITTKPELKEYEKLLIAEKNRQLNVKAENLVELGCFSQVEEKELDFRPLSKITVNKYKNRYDLYQNTETGDLMFVCPLTEEDPENPDKPTKPYAYDCLKVESMDDATYEKVLEAGRNLTSAPDIFYKAGIISYFVLLAITLFSLIALIATYISNGSDAATTLSGTFAATAPLLGCDVIMCPVMTLASIKYRKYKNSK